MQKIVQWEKIPGSRLQKTTVCKHDPLEVILDFHLPDNLGREISIIIFGDGTPQTKSFLSFAEAQDHVETLHFDGMTQWEWAHDIHQNEGKKEILKNHYLENGILPPIDLLTSTGE